MRRERPGILYCLLTTAAGALLSLGLVQSSWALTATDCSTCHGADVVEGHHDAADPNSYFNQGLCRQCHVGVTTGNDCATCHKPAGLDNRHHIPPTGQTAVDCTRCHTGQVDLVNCLSCHAGKVMTRHHQLASGGASCISCHPSVPGATDCRSCHGVTRDAHHLQAEASGTLCAGCHARLSPPGDCHSCHVPGSERNGHHVAATANGWGCSTCHHSEPLSTMGCRDCHQFTGGVLNPHHNTQQIWITYGIGCHDCHTFPNGATTPAPVAATDCVDCHKGVVNATGIDQVHHATAPAMTGNCAGCHAGMAPGPQECTDCHQARAPISFTHHISAPAQADRCDTCHSGIDAASLACTNCHGAGATPSLGERHHASPLGMTNSCLTCHPLAAMNEIRCTFCHRDTEHHLQPSAIAGNCTVCHGTAQLVGGSCAGCHDALIPQLHHGDPLTAVGGNCAVCHQSVSDPSICANCHVSSPHHTTTWAQNGECARCHAVPASAADRPAQAACRECHAGMQHANGPGPAGIQIQNYGSCAACHKTIPFHPAPATNPGYTGYGAGKGKFNMFWSRYARRGEELSPNGESLGDEGGNRIKAQQLTFSTTRITAGDGKQYTVPYFTGMTATNLALKKAATASRSESGHAPALATDGDVTSRWWAKGATATTAQWLTIDLGTLKTIGKVALRWHSYYASEYEIRVSSDNRTWTRVADANYGKGGLEQWNFSGRSVRYVQVYCQKAATTNGFAVYELEIYAP